MVGDFPAVVWCKEYRVKNLASYQHCQLVDRYYVGTYKADTVAESIVSRKASVATLQARKELINYKSHFWTNLMRQNPQAGEHQALRHPTVMRGKKINEL